MAALPNYELDGLTLCVSTLSDLRPSVPSASAGYSPELKAYLMRGDSVQVRASHGCRVVTGRIVDVDTSGSIDDENLHPALRSAGNWERCYLKIQLFMQPNLAQRR